MPQRPVGGFGRDAFAALSPAISWPSARLMVDKLRVIHPTRLTCRSGFSRDVPCLRHPFRVLLSGRDALLSGFSRQLRPVGLADVLGFVALGRELGVGLPGVGFE